MLIAQNTRVDPDLICSTNLNENSQGFEVTKILLISKMKFSTVVLKFLPEVRPDLVYSATMLPSSSEDAVRSRRASHTKTSRNRRTVETKFERKTPMKFPMELNLGTMSRTCHEKLQVL